ncbi:MAG TPA: replicative DNA helicase [Thermoleophilia bacterium]|nr:replicative DNA helicase [Thermoleophilia bacterium]
MGDNGPGRAGSKTDYVPPQNLDAEVSVLGALMVAPNLIPGVTEVLRPVHFYRRSHQYIYEVIEDLYGRGEPVDPIMVSEALSNQARLEEVGGRAFVHSMVSAVPAATNARYYAEIVRENYMLRSLIEVGTGIAELGYRREGEPVDLIDRAEQMVFDISQNRVSSEFHRLSDLISENFAELEKIMSEGRRTTGVETGFRRLDEKITGFQPANLVILAARPSMGKTALALNIARNVAVDQGKGVALFSLEMSRMELVQRMMCSEARVDSHRLRHGLLQPAEWSKLTAACTPLFTAPIYIDDTASVNLMEIRAKSRRLKAKEKGLGLIIIDYLQLMMGDASTENRQQEISRISRGLKILARDLDIPVLALSQLSRQVEQRAGNKRPVLSDLRESGAIEQDADLVLFIYRDEVYNKDSADKGIAEIVIGKQRNGPIGEAKLAFIERYTRFSDMQSDQRPDAARRPNDREGAGWERS